MRSVKFQFVARAVTVIVHGPNAQLEAVGDFRVRVIVSNEVDDAPLGRHRGKIKQDVFSALSFLLIQCLVWP
jgi:hypothetical protein